MLQKPTIEQMREGVLLWGQKGSSPTIKGQRKETLYRKLARGDGFGSRDACLSRRDGPLPGAGRRGLFVDLVWTILRPPTTILHGSNWRGSGCFLRSNRSRNWNGVALYLPLSRSNVKKVVILWIVSYQGGLRMWSLSLRASAKYKARHCWSKYL